MPRLRLFLNVVVSNLIVKEKKKKVTFEAEMGRKR